MASAPTPPTPPDPTATATAQGQSDVGVAAANAWLNNPNVNNAFGSSTTSQTGWQRVQQPDGSWTRFPTFTVDQTLSPEQQRLYDQQTRLGSQMNGVAKTALTGADAALSHPLSSSNYQPITTSVGNGPTFATGYDQGGQVKGLYGLGAVQNGYDAGGPIQSSVGMAFAPKVFGASGPIQNSVGYQNANTNLGYQKAATTFGSAPNVQTSVNTNFQAQADQATNAALARLQPNVDQSTQALTDKLANQGVQQGSAAWQAAMLSNNQSVNDLRLGAVATGDAEQQALFGESLGAGNFANSAQQQIYGQALGRGQFAQAGTALNNAASLGAANYNLSAIGQNNAAQLNAGNFANAAQAQGFGQAQARGLFAQQGTAQNNAARLAVGEFANSAQGQQNAENAGAATFANQAAGQTTAQNAGLAQFQNAAQAQQYGQNAQNAGFYNSSSQNAWQNAMQNAQFGNQAVAQQQQADMAFNNQSINQISALMNGGQVTAPQFSPYQTSQIQNSQIGADTYATAGLQNQQWMQQANMAAQTNAGLFGLGSAFLGAGGTAMGGYLKSDARLKKNAVLLGKSPIGIPIYAFHYLSDDDDEAPFIGHMAQDVARVRPEAVRLDRDGFLSVNYGGLH